MKYLRKRLFSIIAIVFTILIAFSTLFSTQMLSPVYAMEDETLKFEETNVLDDLQSMQIDGKPFSLNEYGFSSFKETKVLAFVEYCYSLKQENNGNYGLYIYVYNPKGLNYVAESPLNSITLGLWDNEKLVIKEYLKFSLEFLNCSMQADCVGLFYKYKINMPDIVKDTFYKSLNASKRQYRVGELELLIDGNTNATSYNVATTYTYTGFAKGYGLNTDAESTLSIKTEDCETISLDVNSTYWRSPGFNNTSVDTQDTLHSVYFAVPNSLLDRYGNLSAIHARWLETILAPALVSGNQAAINAITPYLGKNIYGYDESLNYMYLGDLEVIHEKNAFAHNALILDIINAIFSNGVRYESGYVYNAATTWADPCHPSLSENECFVSLRGARPEGNHISRSINTLSLLFNCENINAEDYSVSSEMLLEELKKQSIIFGDKEISNKYSKCLFDWINSDYTEKTIKATDKLSLINQKISYESAWKEFWGDFDIINSDFNDIECVYQVNSNDLLLSKSAMCQKLYIDESDYDDFVNFYNLKDKIEPSTVFLFRFDVSDYTSQKATLLEQDWKNSDKVTWNIVDDNAYFFQETAYLDFDIIDITLSNGQFDTVIPVVSSPLDIVSGSTPPLDKYLNETSSWVIIIIIVLVFIVVIFIVVLLDKVGLLPIVGKGFVFILSLPIRGIKLIAKAIKDKKKKKPKGKNKVKKRLRKKKTKKSKRKKKGG